MTGLRTTLGNALAADGWRFCERRGEASQAWWADEEWVIESGWQDSDVRLYLTFLIEPAHDGVRRRGQGVWAVGVSRRRPRSAAEARGEIMLPAGPRWAQHLPRFIAALARLREAHVNPFADPGRAVRGEPA